MGIAMVCANLNLKTLILKDSSVRSIWTYLTASPCYTTNTNKHDNTTDIIILLLNFVNLEKKYEKEISLSGVWKLYVICHSLRILLWETVQLQKHLNLL